jgi:RNA polymerase sigma factor (sigma-70 family)
VRTCGGERYEGLPDGVLARMARDGDPDAYGALVVRHQQWVFAVAQGASSNHEDAQDVASAAFENAYRGLVKGLRPPDDFRAYITRVTQNAAHRHRRRTQEKARRDREANAGVIPASGRDAPQERRAIHDDAAALMRDAIGCLTPDLRQAVLMRYSGDEPSYRDIAVAMGTGVDGAEKRVKRGIDALRTHLQRTGKAELLRDAMTTQILVGAPAADFVARTMQRISDAPDPRNSSIKIAGSAGTAIAVAAAIGVALVAGLGSLIWQAGDVDYYAPAGSVEVTLIPGPAPARNRPVYRPSDERVVLAGAAGVSGWIANDPVRDGGRPVVQTHHTNGPGVFMMTLSDGAVRRDIEPTHGVVTLSMSIRPTVEIAPHRGAKSAALRIGFVIDGEVQPANSYGVYLERNKRNQWVYPRVVATIPGVAPSRDDADVVQVASVERRWYEVILTHDTARGTFDAWLDGELVAKGVQRPWTAGRPVTGLYVGAVQEGADQGEPVYTGGYKAGTAVGHAVYFGRTRIAVEGEAPTPHRVGSWTGPQRFTRWADLSVTGLVQEAGQALGAGDLLAARDIVDVALRRAGTTDGVTRVSARLAAAETAAAADRIDAVADLQRLRDEVDLLVQDKKRQTSDATFAAWAVESGSVAGLAWNDWYEDLHGGRHLDVTFAPEHYHGDVAHLFWMAREVVRAFHLLNPDYDGRVAVGVLPAAAIDAANGADVINSDDAIVAAATTDLGPAFHRDHSPTGQAPPPYHTVTRIVATEDGQAYANHTGGLLTTRDHGATWEAADTDYDRVEVLWAQSGAPYGYRFLPGDLVTLGRNGAWRNVRPDANSMLRLDAYLGVPARRSTVARRRAARHLDASTAPLSQIAWLADRVYAETRHRGIEGIATRRSASYPAPAWQAALSDSPVGVAAGDDHAWARETLSAAAGNWLFGGSNWEAPGGGTRLDWRAVGADAHGQTDLTAVFARACEGDPDAAYLRCYIYSPDARRVALHLADTGPLKAVVNGEPIADSAPAHSRAYSIALRPGRNELLVSTRQVEPDWKVTARFLPDGMDGVRFAARPDERPRSIPAVDGTAWFEVTHGMEGRALYRLLTAGGKLYAGTYMGVWKLSEADLRWSRVDDDVEYDAHEAYDLAEHRGALYSARKLGVYRQDPGTGLWEKRSDGLVDHNVRSVASTGAALLAGTYQGHIYRSIDDARTWTLVYAPQPDTGGADHAEGIAMAR